VGGKFYSDVWVNGGRELANEIIKKNEKDTHDAREEAKRAEEAAEHERRIGIVFDFLALVLALRLRTNSLPITAKLSPPPESYNPLADPEMKEALDIISVANSIIDEVVDKLLNEVKEKVLREKNRFYCNNILKCLMYGIIEGRLGVYCNKTM
jgi:predicted transcriptional regulator of viral defense system